MAAAATAMEGVPLEVPIWLRSRAEKPKERYLNDVVRPTPSFIRLW